MAHEVTWEQDGVYRRFWGIVRAAEYARVQAAAFGDARFDGLRYILADLTAVTEFVHTDDDLEEIIAATRGAYLSNARLQVAVVTQDEPFAVLLRRLMQLSPYPVRVFLSLAEARAWLDGPNATRAPAVRD